MYEAGTFVRFKVTVSEFEYIPPYDKLSYKSSQLMPLSLETYQMYCCTVPLTATVNDVLSPAIILRSAGCAVNIGGPTGYVAGYTTVTTPLPAVLLTLVAPGTVKQFASTSLNEKPDFSDSVIVAV